MSWDMWHVYGYGFETDSSRITEEKLMRFIKNHHDSLEKISPGMTKMLDAVIEDVEKEKKIPDWAEDEIKNCVDCGCYGEIIAKVMKAETGIDFCCTGMTDEGEEAVIFMSAYPWEYNEKEKTLTKDSLTEIFRKYGEELMEDVVVDNIDYIDYVFSG